MSIIIILSHSSGSDGARIAVETACRNGSKQSVYPLSNTEDVIIEVNMKGDGPCVGQDAVLSIILKNKCRSPRSLTLYSQVAAMYYTRAQKALICRFVIKALFSSVVPILEWILQYEDYKEHLVDQAALMLTLSGRVSETTQILTTQFNFRLRTSDLIIITLCGGVVGKEMTFKIKFQNPLPCVLKNVIFRFEGLGLQYVRTINYGDIPSLAAVSLTETFVPKYHGQHKLLASLDCPHLTQKPLPCVLKNVIFRIEGLGMQHVKTIHYGDIAEQASMCLTETVVPKRSGPQKLLATLDCTQLTQVHGVPNILVKDH
ncbi:protein-glutamine gamma-glutamyltransferase K-like [Carassius carassius]|uniref:protein-glutamine gamma-glutamyltransferase K-like n=1 Tax=Carassius carassius TaxID=217509 RepID=UPI00286869CC|nr:protein-glutamine gamma-glutamyltransferase K-like [Carassius carassius]